MINISILLLAVSGLISSPQFGKYVTATPPCYLDSSVVSSNSPGSVDFDETEHRNFDKRSATAYYAIFDGYYQRANLLQGNVPLSSPLSKNVATNALVDYYNFLNIAANLTNELYSAGCSSLGGVGGLSSSAFLDMYGGTPSNATNFSTIDLDQWKCMMTIQDLDKGLFTTKDYIYGGEFLFYSICSYVNRHEYLPSARTLTDDLYDFSFGPIGLDYVGCVSNVFGSHCYINHITNNSYALSWKPLSAVSQALSLLDMQYSYGGFQQYYFPSNITSYYSVRATSELGDYTVHVDSDGSAYFLTSPIPFPHHAPEFVGSTNITYSDVSNMDPFYRLYVGSCNSGSVQVGGSKFLDRGTVFLDVEKFVQETFELQNWTTRVDVITSCEWNPDHGTIVFNVDFLIEGNVYTIVDGQEEPVEISGDYEVPLSATCSAGYFTLGRYTGYKDRFGSYTPIHTNAQLHTEIYAASYACSTNIDFENWWHYGGYVDFDYNPPESKPSPRDSSMRWGYRVGAGTAYGNSATNGNAAHAAIINHVNTYLTSSMVDDMKGVVGDFQDPDTYIEFDSSDFNDLLDRVTSVYPTVSIEKPVETNSFTLTICNQEIEPKTYTVDAEMSLHVSAQGTGKKEIHPCIGGDIHFDSRVRSIYYFNSIKLN